MKELFNLLNIFGEWSGGEGEEKGEKNYSSDKPSLTIKWCLII